MFLGTLSAGVLVASALGDSSGDRASSSPAQVAAGYFVVLLVLFYVFSFAYSWGWVAKHTHAHQSLSLVVCRTCFLHCVLNNSWTC